MTERNAQPPQPVTGGADHIDGDVCIDLVAGLVTRADLDRILKHIEACRSCETLLIASGGDWETIRSRPAPDNWRAESPPLPAAVGRVHRGVFAGRFSILRVAVPLSLAAAILVVVLVFKSRTPTAELSYWIPATGEILKLRSAHSTEADSLFWVGLKAYQERDIRTAAALLAESRTGGGMDDLRRLHLASLLLNSGRAGEAMEILKKLDIESLPQPWSDEAGWMEYLALVQLGQSREAAERLAAMAEWPGRIGDLARERRAR